MKVVIVNDYANVNGGAAKVALQSAMGLAKRGYPVEFFASVGRPDPRLEEHGINITRLDQLPYNRDPKVLRSVIRGIWNQGAACRFRALLGKCDPENTIVHFHMFRNSLTTSVAYAASRMGFPMIYTAHEYAMGCPYGGFFNYRKNRICEQKGLSAGCLASHCNTGSYAKKLWNYANHYFFAKIMRIPALFDHIIYPSNTARKILQSYVPAGQRASSVSNPFDAMAGRAVSIKQSSSFIFIGSLVPHKDPLTAARAAKKLGARILFAGAGQLEEEIKRVNPEAEITGWLDRDEIIKRMASSRALVFPSIWYEAQPLTVMEAAASGLSIIAADASAATEEIELLGTGAVFRSGDVNDLAAKMAPYMNDAYAQEKGAAAFAAFRRLDLSEERHINRLLDIYNAEQAQRRNRNAGE
jgi:glycosyltransferase involved in cell wall biosynthesis